MGIDNFTIDHSVADAVGAAQEKAQSTFSQIVGSAESQMNHLFTGGSFVGISYAGLGEFLVGMEKYVTSIQEILNDFNEEADISNAFAGKPREAASEFIRSIKQLLTAYVSSLRMLKDEAVEISDNWNKGAEVIQSAVEGDAATLRSSASEINLDI